jgi:heptosyltransferase-1
MPPIPFDKDPQRILFIKPSAIGDVVHSLPILSLLRKRFPAAQISWLIAPNCAGLLEGHADLNQTILFDRKRLGQAWRNPAAAMELVALHRRLRSAQFDLVVDLQGLLRSGWLSRTTGAPVRIGFANAREGAPWFYTHRVEIKNIEQHAIERYLKVAAALGCDIDAPLEYKFPVRPEHREHVLTLLESADPYAVLLPGTNWLTKRWPAERFAELVKPLHERFGLRSIIAGGADAAALAKDIPGALNLAGTTNLLQLVALLEGAALVVANDSGPMHIAAALDRPLVTMFGPTNPIRTGPYGKMQSVVRNPIECSPCYSRKCSHISCLRHLGSGRVLERIEEQLSSTRPRGLPILQEAC